MNISLTPEPDQNDAVRTAQLSEFNSELSRRLSALSLGETVDPELSRARLQAKSKERRK